MGSILSWVFSSIALHVFRHAKENLKFSAALRQSHFVEHTWKLARIVSQRNLLDRGSIPVDGSSIKTTAGFPTIDIAKLSFLRVPPEQVEARLFACSFI